MTDTTVINDRDTERLLEAKRLLRIACRRINDVMPGSALYDGGNLKRSDIGWPRKATALCNDVRDAALLAGQAHAILTNVYAELERNEA